ncbi:dihydropteroate synthase [Zwartia panacis]|uniref:dihydropteroate synthase n=1 Tax=Zwartia panacis TaxID=2683345 RepID=UPI0025B51D9C|nr:dihydropteroate synthase [Zwartia panacis]MDN4015442.1 dihydropteroate synthase [Zwartia panacis]
MAERWVCGRFEFDLKRPILMGIVNVTPDSFSDGGQHARTESAIRHAHTLIQEGADILDIGGESTRPGALPVSVQDELARVIPVIKALLHSGVAISVDTCKPEVMQAALDVGADIINDVTGMRDVSAQRIVARHGHCGVCVMHMQGEPRTMQTKPHYNDVVHDIHAELVRQAHQLESLGIQSERISLDPGFGFGKTVEQNYQLLANLNVIANTGYPVVLGVSRKSMIGAVTGQSVDHRLSGSISAALAGVVRGARVLRVHDVRETRDALSVWHAVEDAKK